MVGPLFPSLVLVLKGFSPLCPVVGAPPGFLRGPPIRGFLNAFSLSRGLFDVAPVGSRRLNFIIMGGVWGGGKSTGGQVWRDRFSKSAKRGGFFVGSSPEKGDRKKSPSGVFGGSHRMTRGKGASLLNRARMALWSGVLAKRGLVPFAAR